jgi:MFS family permease
MYHLCSSMTMEQAGNPNWILPAVRRMYMLAWRKGFYGYVIVPSAFLVYFVLGGAYYSQSVLAPVMAAELGWSAAALGVGFSIYALTTTVCAPLVGAFVLRFGPRLAVLVGALLVAVALVLLTTTTTTWQFYVFVILLGIGIHLGAPLPTQQLVGNWFVLRRSLFLGLVLSGAGLGGLFIATLAASLIAASGSWRTAWQALAGLMLIPVLIALLLLRNRPEELGQRADGISQEPDPDLGTRTVVDGPDGRVYRTMLQWETRNAIKTRSFWLIALAAGVMFFLLQATTAHQVAYLAGEAGLDLAIAASALGLVAGSSVIGRLVAGWLGDRVEPRYVIAGLLLAMGLSLLILMVGQGLVALYVYVVLFGVGYGGIIVVTSAAFLNYFGTSRYAQIMGISMPVGAVLGILSPLLVGGIKDATGSYLPAFVLMIGTAVAGALFAALARPPVHQEATSARVQPDSVI